MTFATHLERQFMQRLRGAGSERSASEPAARANAVTKGWIETTKSGRKTWSSIG